MLPFDSRPQRGRVVEQWWSLYWIVDPAPPVSLLACHQAGELGYADSGEVAGVFTTEDPFGVRLDLADLA